MRFLTVFVFVFNAFVPIAFADWSLDQAKIDLGKNATKEQIKILAERYRNVKDNAYAFGMKIIDYKALFGMALTTDEVEEFYTKVVRPTYKEVLSLEKLIKRESLSATDINNIRNVTKKSLLSRRLPNANQTIQDLMKGAKVDATEHQEMEALILKLKADGTQFQDWTLFHSDSLYQRNGRYFLKVPEGMSFPSGKTPWEPSLPPNADKAD